MDQPSCTESSWWPVSHEVEQNKEDEDERPNPAHDSGFQFLNFSNFNETKAKETKSRVRSHVMHGVHQKKKSGKESRPSGSIDLDISLLPLRPQATQPEPDLVLPNLESASPERMGSGRNDPFQRYPIEMNERTLELYDHLRGDFCPMFKTMSKIGFFRSITDPAGFLQILCTSVSHMTTLRYQPVAQNPEAIALSTQAIQSINSRLGDPAVHTNDGVVAAILTFCCHTTMFNDVPGSKTHIDGLEAIIERRGGLGTLDSNPAMRMVMFWVDTNYSFMTDTVPRFPFPDDLLPGIAAPTPNIAPFLLAEACTVEDLASAIYGLYGLNQLMINEAGGRDIWVDGVFSWTHIVPVLHKLLLIRYEQLDSGSAVLRAGGILYIAAIRRRFGARFLTHVQIRKLRTSMIILLEDIEPIRYDASVWLWLLVLGCTLSFLKEDHDWFISQTAQYISAIGYGTWTEVIGNHVQNVLWINDILVPELESLRVEISTIMWNSYRRELG